MNGFHSVTASSLVGIATIALLSTVKATDEHQIWANTERSIVQLQSKADLEQVKAKTTKDIADGYSTHQVTTFSQLIIKNYTFSNKPLNSTGNTQLSRAKKPSSTTNTVAVSATPIKANSTSSSTTQRLVKHHERNTNS